MNCKHFKRRSKDYKRYFYCTHPSVKKEISWYDCKNCEFKEYKSNGSISTPWNYERNIAESGRNTAKSERNIAKKRKPIKQRTSKQAKLERERFSIFTDDLTTCIECGKKYCNINLHEIFYGTGKRKLSIKYGLVIPLCSNTCHNQVNSQGIHFDVVMRSKWHKIGQKKAMEYYNWDIEKFIEVFGKNYL